MSGLLGKKIGMTRIPLEDGRLIAVTLVAVEPNIVTQVKTLEKDGYNAIAVGFERKVADVTQKVKGNLARKYRFVREFHVTDPAAFQKDQELSVTTFEGIEAVSVQSTSKGKGFAGVVRRHHFKGGPRTHGAKMQRAPGSIGTRKPRRTKKGHRMPGHLGSDVVTLRHVPVVRIDKEHNIIALKGPVPGSINSLVKMWIPNAAASVPTASK